MASRNRQHQRRRLFILNLAYAGVPLGLIAKRARCSVREVSRIVGDGGVDGGTRERSSEADMQREYDEMVERCLSCLKRAQRGKRRQGQSLDIRGG